MKYLTFISLEIKRLSHKIIQLIFIFSIVFFLGFISTEIAKDYFSENPLRLKISVVNLDKSEEMDWIIRYVLNDEEILKSFEISSNESIEEAMHLLMSKEISAFILLPEEFLQGVLSGENPSPELYISNANLLEEYIIKNLATSLSDVLVNVQSGVYTTIDFAKQGMNFSNDMILDVNLAFISSLLKRAETFDVQHIDYTDMLPLSEFYFFTTFIFLMSLSSLIFFESLNFSHAISYYSMLNTKGISYQKLYFLRISPLFVLYFILFLTLVLFTGADMSITFLLTLLVLSIFFVLLQSIIFNVFNSFITSAQMNILLHGLFWILSGGLIPLTFFPDFIQKISIFSPCVLMRNLLSSSNVDQNLIMLNSISLLISIVFILINLRLSSINFNKT